MKRTMLTLITVLLLLGLTAACVAPAPPAAPAADTGDTTSASTERVQMTFWMNFNFVEEVNEVVRRQVQDWADANNVEIDILIAPDTDLAARWAAGMEAPDTLPDVSVVFVQMFPKFMDADLLLDVSDVYTELDGMAGGFYPAAGEVVTVDGRQYGVPYIGSVTPAYWRIDKLEEAGLSEPPATYEEMLDFCEAVNVPGEFWCYGLAFAGFSDTEGELRNLIWSYGGSVVAEDGTTITINSPETLEALYWLQEMLEMGSFPPDAAVGDDAGNNRWYQTGSVATVVNTGSILAWLQENDEDLLANTLLTPSPSGPAGRHGTGGFGAVVGAFNTTEHPELAKSLLAHFAHPDQVWERTEAASFGNLPVHQDAGNDPVWEDPYLKPFIEQLQYVHPTGWPGPVTTAAQEVRNQQVLGRMLIRMAVEGESPEDALAWAEQEIQRIYAEFPPQ